MTVSILVLVAAALSGPLLAETTAELSLLGGGRSAPETALELPGEWDGELDPGVLGALALDLDGSWTSGLWLGGSAAAWGYLPDPEGTCWRSRPAAAGGGPRIAGPWSSPVATATRLLRG